MSRRSEYGLMGLSYSTLVLFSLFFLFPVVHVLLISLKSPVDAFAVPTKWLFVPTFEHHRYLWLDKGFSRFLMNSLAIGLGTVCISVPTATLAAYGLVRHAGKLSSAILFVLLSLRMFPHMLLVIPYFLLARQLSLYDSRLVMILVMVAFNQPFAIWLMRGFMLNVPRELDEAAVIDGCRPATLVWRVIVPVILPGMATTAIFSFLLAYNDYLFALVLTGTRAKTLAVAIGEYGAENIMYWSISAAGVSGVIMPVIIIMIFLQKAFVKGLTSGAIK
jgi:multiple sugar transport system permease protein